MNGWFSPFVAHKAPPTPSPAVTAPAPPKPVREAPARNTGHSGDLSQRLAVALEPYQTELGTAGLAKKLDVNPGTVVRIRSGIGLNLRTLQKLCDKLGWTVTITDEQGNPI